MTVVGMCASLAAASPAAAQSTYVGGSLMGEIARFSKVDYDETFARVSSAGLDPSRDGETLGFNVRLGRRLAERWGVEFEFARGGVHERHRSQSVWPLVTGPAEIGRTLPGIDPRILPVPDIELMLETEQEHTTFASTVFVQQDVSDRVTLAFSGGVSFNRVESEQRFRLTDPRLALYVTYPSDIESVQHAVGPVVGAEAIVDVGEHAAITGGVRMHGVTGGWLLRPAVGLRWSF